MMHCYASENYALSNFIRAIETMLNLPEYQYVRV